MLLCTADDCCKYMTTCSSVKRQVFFFDSLSDILHYTLYVIWPFIVLDPEESAYEGCDLCSLLQRPAF